MAAAASAQAPSDRRAIAIRAAARGLLGALIGGVIGDVWYFNSPGDWKFPTWDWTFSIVLLLVDIVAMATTVAIAEIVVPAIRVPDGKAYGPLRHHHLTTAAAQGAVVGVIVRTIGAALLFGAYFRDRRSHLYLYAVPPADRHSCEHRDRLRSSAGRPATNSDRQHSLASSLTAFVRHRVLIAAEPRARRFGGRAFHDHDLDDRDELLEPGAESPDRL